jgi:hypothetical protein
MGNAAPFVPYSSSAFQNFPTTATPPPPRPQSDDPTAIAFSRTTLTVLTIFLFIVSENTYQLVWLNFFLVSVNYYPSGFVGLEAVTKEKGKKP